MDKVWNYAAIVQPENPPKRMILCATLNVPKLDQPKQGEHSVHLHVLEDSSGKFHYYIHDDWGT